ncbi:hypothetical protein P7C70_g1188, partial [Phenoliferia sp. Uapishka_3]
MGANGSSEGGAGAKGAGKGKPRPEDHYEVLGITSEATSNDIKKAYRSAALRDHPDKNPNDVAGATIRFAKIQGAYEVLSDEQERAWYDDHRDDILAGGGENTEADASYFDSMRRGAAPKPRAHSRGLTADQLMRFFTTAAWSGLDDSTTGFYTTFRTLFALIAAEEAQLGSPLVYPVFGSSQSSYVSSPARPTDIRQFYGAWLNFSTEKDFNWRDQYRPEEGMDRRTKRMIEKENTRERGQGKKEYNECVRNLVLYVRRRDPRYTMSQSSLSPDAFREAESARLRADLLLAAKERAKEREKEAEAYRASAPEWQRHADDEGSGSDEDENEDEEQWCVACSKGFRSGGAWDNHERSRKHVKNLEKLIKEMHEEDEELNLSRDPDAVDEHTPSPPPTASSSRSSSPTPSDDASQPSHSTPPSQEHEELVKDLARNLATVQLPSAEEVGEAPTSGKRKTRGGKVDIQTPVPTSVEDEAGDDDMSEVVGMARKSRRVKGKGKSGSGVATPVEVPASEPQEDAEEMDESLGKVKKSRRAKGKGKASGTSTPVPVTNDAQDELDVASTTRPDAAENTPAKKEPQEDDGTLEMSKKDKRRAKEAARKLEDATGPGDLVQYEEWALKAIDPALSPTPWSKPGTPRPGDDGKVTLLYPPSLLSPGPLLDALKAQLAHREPHHKSAMWKCLLGAPLTFPFAIIPVVPNFPLFYVLWRAWSHWRGALPLSFQLSNKSLIIFRTSFFVPSYLTADGSLLHSAWKASSYLNSLLTASQITLEPSASLDTVYDSSSSTPDLLLTVDKVPKIVEAFKLNEDEAAELRRAVTQAEARLKQGATIEPENVGKVGEESKERKD